MCSSRLSVVIVKSEIFEGEIDQYSGQFTQRVFNTVLSRYKITGLFKM